MLGIVGVWPSKHGEIIKSELSNGRRKKLLPSVVEFTYDWLRFEGYLGNVGQQFSDLTSKQRVDAAADPRFPQVAAVTIALRRNSSNAKGSVVP